MAKQLNVSLAFNADTSQAKKEILDLQKALTNVTSFSKNNAKLFDITSIKEAEKAAKELSQHLMKATDINTGKINLSTFAASLRNSGNDLNSYQKKLEAIGPVGERAFLQLSKSIANAESPLLRTNSKLKEFQTTLMNTARWQISSSILHGFMGALQSAYGYAQDLNQSLNNIRIVTGYGSDEMAKFAEQANKAAQALSTTTTSYTDAALIYYQQGIRDQEEIAGRTETTIKLANVSRQSAEEVSSQMTAIWNNFDDGSHSLEYYADVITALGANTASSSQEIAKGMQQFAAVADTVGLSYEYAAASLATIVATTRQSESTVGNGLRTIFSRLEGLKLGDTLEDGTDLNKYSAALATVGVNIKDASGSLKDMDTILEETASKWDQLDKAQKVAFATTVGGVRQYTNLIALLDNWDMVQENIGIAKGSEGTLQKQADIYAESWEAAEKRVRASAEEIYSSILNDKFFISINDFFAKFLNGINGAIKGFGGLKGVLLSIGSIFTQTYAKEAPLILDRIKESLLIISGQANQVALTDQNKNLAWLNQEKNSALKNVNTDAGSVSYLADVSGAEQLAQRKQELIRYQAEYNSLEKATAEQEIEDLKQANEQLLNKAKAYEEIEHKLNNRAQLLNQKYGDRDVTTLAEFSKTAGILDVAKNAVSGFSIEIQSLQKELKGTANNTDEVSKKSQEYAQNLRNILNMASSVSSGQNANLLDGFSKDIEENIEKLKKGEIEVQEFLDRLEKIKERASNIMDKQSSEAQSDINTNIRDATGKVIPELQNFSNAYRENAKSGGEVILTSGRVGNSISQLSPHLVTTSEILVSTTSGLMSFAGALRGVKSTLNTFSNKDSDAIDKIGAAIGLMTTSLMLFNNVGKMAKTVIAGYTAAQKTAEIATNGLLTATQKQTVAQAAQNAVAAANPYILGATAAIMAVTAVIGLLTWHTQQLTEAQKEEAQQTKERADQINQEAEENEKLISSMDDLLNRYKDGEDVKEELDSVTNALADAYDIEGAAVARLTGRYEDYEAALNNAKQKKIEMLDQQISDTKIAMDAAGRSLLSAAKGSWYDNKGVSSDNTYSFSIESSQSTLNDTYDKKAMEILRKNISSANMQNYITSDNSGMLTGLGTTFSIENIDKNLNQLVNLYHEIEKAKSEIGQEIGSEAATRTDIVKALNKYSDSIKEEIQGYEDLSQTYESLTQKRYNPIDQVKSYDDYKIWIEKTRSSLKEANYDDNFISEYISNEYKNATKEVQKFADAYQASQDIIKKSNVSEENIAKAFGAEEGYDANVAALMNWSMLSDETWESAYQGAKKYYNAIQQSTQATEDLANAQNALSDFGTKLTKSSTKKLVKDLEWGKTDENGNEIIMQYSDFLLLSSEKQLSYLKNLEKEAAISTKETLQEQIEFEKNVLQEYYDWRSSEQAKQDAQARDDAQKTINDIQLIRAAFTKDSDINKWSDDDKNLLNQYGNGVTNLSAFNDNVSETEESAQNTISIYDDKITAIQNYEDHITSMNQSMQEASLTESLMYENLSELNQAFSTGSISGSDYRTALVTMAAEYSNCEAEINNYKQALEEHNTAAIKAAKEELELAIAAGETAKKAGYEEKEFEKLTKEVKNLAQADKIVSKETQESEKHLTDVAKAAKQTEQGLDKLNKGWKNWKEALKSKDELQKISSMEELKDALADVMDISDELEKYGMTLGDHFGNYLLENMDKVEAAANGDRDAILDLQQVATEDILIQLGFDEAANQELFNYLDETMDLIRSKLDDGSLKIGAVDDTDLINSLNQMISVVGNDVDAAQKILTGLGFNATFVPGEASKEDQYWVPAEYDTTSIPTGGEEVSGNFDALRLKTPGHWESVPGTMTTQALKIDTLNYTGGGNVSGASGGTGRHSGGGKGGGGGGKGSKAPKAKDKVEKKEKEKKRLEDEEERYHEINQELQRTSHLLNQIGKEKDRAYGVNKIKNIQQESKYLERQIGQYKELKRQAEAYRKSDAEKLSKYGAQINENGVISNYTEMLAAEVDRYNAAYDAYIDAQNKAIEEYNAKLVDGMEDAAKEAAEEELKAANKAAETIWEAAQLYYEDFSKWVGKYEESVAKVEEAEENIQEATNQIYDNELEAITHLVEVWNNFFDGEIAYLEFLLKQIGNGADRALDRMSDYTEQIGNNMEKIDNYQRGIEDTLSHMGLDFEDLLNDNIDFDDLPDTITEDDISTLMEYRDGLISCGEQLIELRKTLLNEVSEAFDEFNSDLDRAIDKIEHLKTFTQTYKNLIDIVGKDVLDPTGETTIMLARTAYTQAESNTKALQSQLDYQLSAIDDYNRVIAELQADNANGQHDDTIKEFKNQLKEAEDAYAATQEEWLSSWEETVQAAADIYEAELNQIIEDFGKSISGLAGSLEDLSQQYERTKDLQDMYVDDYEKIYQLSKLNRDINKSIDDTENIRSKQRLRDLQSQINDLQASETEMSEYELENLRRRYELELASLQLEESREAKSQVRMVRDNEGNWGYVYTADETAVEEAEQNYEDKLYAMQKANTEYIESLEAEIIRVEQEWADALAEIKVQDYASYEEYKAAIDACNEYYSKKLNQTYSQMNIVLNENKRLYQEDWSSYSAATGYKISEDERFIDKFEETNYSMITGYKNIEDAQQAYLEATGDNVDSVTNRMSDAYDEWYRRTDEALVLGGTSMETYAQDVEEYINGDGGIVDQTVDAQEAVDEMAQKYDDKFTEIIDYAENFAMNFDDVIQSIIESCNEAIEAIQRLLEAMAEAADTDFEPDAGGEEIDTYADWEEQHDDSGNLVGWKAKDKSGNYITGSGRTLAWSGNDQISGYTATYDFDDSGMMKVKSNAIGSGFAGTDWDEEERKKHIRMATGGYTGDWGNSPRLAWLDQKELVLNSEDTSNILSAVGMIRDIAQIIDLTASSTSGMLSNLFSANVSPNSETLEQTVTITADFPNVQNRSEIEEAFDNLINKAAQYANRKI